MACDLITLAMSNDISRVKVTYSMSWLASSQEFNGQLALYHTFVKWTG